MNELELRDELATKRRVIQNFKDLTKFLKYVKENCNCGYGEAPRAIAQANLAVAWYFAKEFDITGFQAGAVMWDFIRDWKYRSNKAGLKIVDYDNMLYPQYEYKFEKTISPSIWRSLQEEAKKNLDSSEYASPNVIAHWRSIADGVVPFGYSVREEH